MFPNTTRKVYLGEQVPKPPYQVFSAYKKKKRSVIKRIDILTQLLVLQDHECIKMFQKDFYIYQY